jgi:TRAP-type mannitol/chloroaromatic compound transport system permease large subunit
MMGITLERSRIAEDLLTTMARVFGPLPGGLAVSIVIWLARSWPHRPGLSARRL